MTWLEEEFVNVNKYYNLLSPSFCVLFPFEETVAAIENNEWKLVSY